MNDSISRQAAIDDIWTVSPLARLDRKWVDRWLRQLPSAQPRKGKWINDGHHIQCDQCGIWMCNTDREGDPLPRCFCPNCGADMREVTE